MNVEHASFFVVCTTLISFKFCHLLIWKFCHQYWKNLCINYIDRPVGAFHVAEDQELESQLYLKSL